MASCPRCAQSLPEPVTTGQAGQAGQEGTWVECSGCGLRVRLTPPEGPTSWLRFYFWQLRELLLRPTRFFRGMSVSGGLAYPLAFALITHWVASAVAFLWSSLFGGGVEAWITRFRNLAENNGSDIESLGSSPQVVAMGDQLVRWFWGVWPVVLDPFITLAWTLATAFLVFIGARLFVPAGRQGADHPYVSYESAVRVVCFGMAPTILAVLPVIGGFASALGVIIVTVIGAREVYRISLGRAIVVALFPKILLLALVLGAVIAFFGVIFAVFRAVVGA